MESILDIRQHILGFSGVFRSTEGMPPCVLDNVQVWQSMAGSITQGPLAAALPVKQKKIENEYGEPLSKL